MSTAQDTTPSEASVRTSRGGRGGIDPGDGVASSESSPDRPTDDSLGSMVLAIMKEERPPSSAARAGELTKERADSEVRTLQAVTESRAMSDIGDLVHTILEEERPPPPPRPARSPSHRPPLTPGRDATRHGSPRVSPMQTAHHNSPHAPYSDRLAFPHASPPPIARTLAEHRTTNRGARTLTDSLYFGDSDRVASFAQAVDQPLVYSWHHALAHGPKRHATSTTGPTAYARPHRYSMPPAPASPGHAVSASNADATDRPPRPEAVRSKARSSSGPSLAARCVGAGAAGGGGGIAPRTPPHHHRISPHAPLRDRVPEWTSGGGGGAGAGAIPPPVPRPVRRGSAADAAGPAPPGRRARRWSASSDFSASNDANSSVIVGAASEGGRSPYVTPPGGAHPNDDPSPDLLLAGRPRRRGTKSLELPGLRSIPPPPPPPGSGSPSGVDEIDYDAAPDVETVDRCCESHYEHRVRRIKYRLSSPGGRRFVRNRSGGTVVELTRAKGCLT